MDRKLAALIDKLEPELRDAFIAAIRDLRSGIDRKALIAALNVGDIEGAVRALNIEAGAFNQYVAARTATYSQAGAAAASVIPTAEATAVAFRFDMTNPRAERWIREQAAREVAGFVQDQIDSARALILDGYSRGQGPQQIALDLAGRIDRVTGSRSGGILGLSDPQAGYVQSMRARLLSGDPAEMRKVLSGMSLRDKRYDALIQKHIKAGTPLKKTDVDRLTQLYSDRLLRRRAEDIARTETAQAVMGARNEAYAQALEKEGLPNDAMTKIWRHNGSKGENARAQHVAMNGVKVKGLNIPFTMPDGTQMQHSHDPAGGADHNVNCRCSTDFEINFAWGLQ